MPPKRRRIEEPAAAQGGNEANPIPHNDFVPLELNRQDNDNQDEMNPYSRFLVFQCMFMTACRSSNFEFRDAMMHIIDKLTLPHYTRIERGWNRDEYWHRRSIYFIIRAEHVANLTTDLRRIRYAEMLRMVRLFWFIGTPRYTYVTIDGTRMLQNRWVYDSVTRVIPRDRLAVTRISRQGLPPLPETYRVLETMGEPPYFTEVNSANLY